MTAALARVRFGYEGPEVPEDVLARLRTINPQLGLRFYQGQGWAVMWKWKDDDRRRAYIQRGELPADEDADIVCWLPDDVTPDQAVAYVEDRASRRGTPHVRALVDDIARDRARTQEDAFADVLGEALNRVEVNPGNLFASAGKRIVKTFQAGFGKGTRSSDAPNA